jgi:hypothetical protein
MHVLQRTHLIPGTSSTSGNALWSLAAASPWALHLIISISLLLVKRERSRERISSKMVGNGELDSPDVVRHIIHLLMNHMTDR